MSIEHATWTVERTYPVSPARVFSAWADPATKRRWFLGPEGDAMTYASDFRVGGTESTATPPGITPALTYDAMYRDIVAEERIVLTYEMSTEGRLMSVSVVAAEFTATADGTRLLYTEQGVYLDGLDTAETRRVGVRRQLEQLGVLLQDR